MPRTARGPPLTPPPLVLAYHAVGNPAPGDYAQFMVTPPELLEEHVELLRRHAYELVTAGELVRRWTGSEPPPGVAALTFDDGWQSDLSVTAPLLERLGVPATFFVCPGLFGNRDERLGESGSVLTEEEARQLAQGPFELGAHTMSHPDARELDPVALAAELAGSKHAIEEITGESCELLAWPFGLWNEDAERAAEEAGFTAAFAFEPGPWRRFAAPRRPAGLLKTQYAAKEK